MWRVWLVLIVLVGGPIAFVWYGVTGETGPIGWLNAMQLAKTGSYSQVMSMATLLVAACLVIVPCLFLWAYLAERRARAGGAPKPVAARPVAPKPAAPAPGAAVLPSGRGSLIFWLSGLALILASVFAWFTWDWRQRLDEVVSEYEAVPLRRHAPVAHRGDGSHLLLQGRLLWEHGVSRKEKVGSSQTETVFVPVVGADWRPGDVAPFVARLSSDRASTLNDRLDGPYRGPLRVRVAGSVPTVVRSFLEQDGAALSDEARLVDPATSQADASTLPRPAFDWEDANLAAQMLSLIWAVAGLALVYRVVRDRRTARRTAGNPRA